MWAGRVATSWPVTPSGFRRARTLLILLAALAGLAPGFAADTPAPLATLGLSASELGRANAALARYHGADPAKVERKLRFVYFAPSDSPPAAQYRERLTRVMEEAGDFFAREFRRVGLTQVQPLAFEREADGLLRFVVVRGREPWKAYNSKQSAAARKVREECLPALREAGIDPETETILLFHTIMEWHAAKRRFREDAPYRGGGDARGGFCWQIDAPPLDPRNLTARELIIDDGQVGKISLGHWNARYIGGVIHELGHALGLDHNAENAAEAKTLVTSLMGDGNTVYGCERHGHGRGAFLSTADALRLASHPLFTGSAKGLAGKDAGEGDFRDLRIENAHGALVITGQVTAPVPTYAVLGYFDGAGRGDYDALTAVAVPDAQGRFRLEQRELPRAKSTQLRLAALKVNGWGIALDSLPSFPVSAEGVADIGDTQTFAALDPIIRLLRQGQAQPARKLTAALPDGDPTKSFASPMLTPPAERSEKVDTAMKELSLCDLRPEQASVGWREPAFDYSPEDLLVTLGGKLQRRFVYAHAPASYTWKLDGSWQRFQATCALGNGYAGSVVFVVKIDGRERWRSGIVRGAAQKACDIALGGAKTLELIVEEGGDDRHRDHGFWFNPVLRR